MVIKEGRLDMIALKQNILMTDCQIEGNMDVVLKNNILDMYIQ